MGKVVSYAGRSKAAPRRKGRSPWILWAWGFCVGAAASLVLFDFDLSVPDLQLGLRSGACNIKGNISQSGERIYHVPGQEYYSATRIDSWKGERWFCSEAEARQTGWRRAKV